jgi:hypothetical protein
MSGTTIFSSRPSGSSRQAARFMALRPSVGAPMHPIGHQTMQMDIRIGGPAEELAERDGSGLGGVASVFALRQQEPPGRRG